METKELVEQMDKRYLPPPLEEAQRGWVCFHCGMEFSIAKQHSYHAATEAARAHFGDTPEERMPRCVEAAERQIGHKAEETIKAHLVTSMVLIDDLLHQYAYDMCSEESVKEAMKRIDENGGTLAYIARTQQANRAILGIKVQTWGELLDTGTQAQIEANNPEEPS